MPAPWVLPVIATALTIGGATLQQQHANKNQRRQIRFAQQQREREHQARMRGNMARLQSLQQQAGFDAKKQSALASALRDQFGDSRQGKIDEAAAENLAGQLGALKQQAKKGNLYSTGTSTKGRVSGKLSKAKAQSGKKNKARHKSRAKKRGLISAYRRDIPLQDQLAGVKISQQRGMLDDRSRVAAQMAEMRARMLGQSPPEEILYLDPNSTLGTLFGVAGAGLGAYSAAGGGLPGGKPPMYGAPGTYGGPGGTQIAHGPNPGKWGTPWGGA